jgi:glycosyltransferase involved in cell wall biosynthesis
MTSVSGIQRTVRSLAIALQKENANHSLAPLPFRLEKAGRNEWAMTAAQGFPNVPAEAKQIAFRRGDTLLMLDSTWDFYLSFVKTVFPVLRSLDGRLITCVYDILPVTHPHLFPKRTVEMFVPWFRAAVEESDGLLGISQATLDEVRRVLANENKTYPPLGFFHLGADFHGGQAAPSISIPSTPPLFLTVGTIEPRKGHSIILDGFEKLWENRFNVRLAIVGREGWNVSPLMRRLRTLNKREDRFSFHENASDAVLSDLYDRSTAVIAASLTEGFGLPLVEALMRNKKVIASDIPAFREVAGDEAMYFTAGSSASLFSAIETLIANPKPAVSAKRRWLSWEQSADMLVKQVGALGGGLISLPSASLSAPEIEVIS